MTTTRTRLAVWQRAAIRAAEMATQKQTWSYGRPADANAVWAAGPGMPTYARYAEPGALAVVLVEWRRPEAFDDDDASTGGYFLALKGNDAVRVQAHVSVFRAEDGTLRLGRWDRELPRQVGAMVEAVRYW